LVEDTPEFVSLIVPLVEAENYEVTVAGTGAEAVEAARGADPDVVLLDVVLPDTSGFEVCRELRTFSSAYVIMLTSRTEEIDRVVGLSVGADDYVTKPFSPPRAGGAHRGDDASPSGGALRPASGRGPGCAGRRAAGSSGCGCGLGLGPGCRCVAQSGPGSGDGGSHPRLGAARGCGFD
jgi:CheY-like chemotaxis protein